jgi:hypothetical protein
MSTGRSFWRRLQRRTPLSGIGRERLCGYCHGWLDCSYRTWYRRHFSGRCIGVRLNGRVIRQNRRVAASSGSPEVEPGPEAPASSANEAVYEGPGDEDGEETSFSSDDSGDESEYFNESDGRWEGGVTDDDDDGNSDCIWHDMSDSESDSGSDDEVGSDESKYDARLKRFLQGQDGPKVVAALLKIVNWSRTHTIRETALDELCRMLKEEVNVLLNCKVFMIPYH